ncbi:hypothetical protein LZK80_09830 [Rhizobium leguminosarum]|nr:hypothetical protein LZK80_09830 [Rhizobium leguminosarum]UIL29504.1 hypothetical protein LZK75_09835 [Rhizobium leguminosarum]
MDESDDPGSTASRTSRLTQITDWIKSVATIFSLLAVPIIVAVLGASVQRAVNSAETRVKTLELAVSIVKERPDLGQPGLRTWAIDVIEKYSDVPLSALAKEEMKSKAILSIQPIQRNISEWTQGEIRRGEPSKYYNHQLILTDIKGNDAIFSIDGTLITVTANDTVKMTSDCVLQLFGFTLDPSTKQENAIVSVACEKHIQTP